MRLNHRGSLSTSVAWMMCCSRYIYFHQCLTFDWLHYTKCAKWSVKHNSSSVQHKTLLACIILYCIVSWTVSSVTTWKIHGHSFSISKTFYLGIVPICYCCLYFKKIFNLKANVYFSNLLLSGKNAHNSGVPSVPCSLLPRPTLFSILAVNKKHPHRTLKQNSFSVLCQSFQQDC